MPVQFDDGYPVWKQGMTPEERRQYRRAKHRAHAKRSRRLRGKTNLDRAKRGERVEYPVEPTPSAMEDQSAYPNRMYPVVGDHNGDGIPD